MIIKWDENKNKTNIRKHGISFETAALVFDDPNAYIHQDRIEQGEERWQTIGTIGGVTVLLVAHTVNFDGTDHEIIRIISARKADKTERRRYETKAY